MKGALIYCVMVLLLASSCRKNNDIDNNPSTHYVSSVIAGDTSSSYGSYTRYQPMLDIIAPWHSGSSSEIDLNDDGSNDIAVSAYWDISPGGLNAHQAYLYTLRDQVKFRFEIYRDTTVSWTVQTPNGVRTYSENYNSSTAYPSNATVNPFVDTSLARLFYGDTIVAAAGDWLPGNYRLVTANFSTNSFTSNDVVLGNFSNESIAFVAFKVELADRIDFGWIELYVTNYSEVHITRKIRFSTLL
jgi:hypothetical protein